jgi:hypothetical protein
MSPLFKKLSLTTQTKIHVLNAPDSFEPELAALGRIGVVRRLSGKPVFVLAFATRRAELDKISAALVRVCEGDAVLWIAYPKGSSKKYRCDFNRDSGWQVLGEAGFEPVRQVPIDADWSALRFRRVENIKVMVRDPAGTISKAGRAKTGSRRVA